METRRVRGAQTAAEVVELLEAFVSSRKVLPTGCRAVRDPHALPAALQVIIVRASQQGRVWACWASSFETFLFTWELSVSRSRELGAPVIAVKHYRERGELQAAGTWVGGSGGNWLPCPGG
jgi:hypothetical protein